MEPLRLATGGSVTGLDRQCIDPVATVATTRVFDRLIQEAPDIDLPRPEPLARFGRIGLRMACCGLPVRALRQSTGECKERELAWLLIPVGSWFAGPLVERLVSAALD